MSMDFAEAARAVSDPGLSPTVLAEIAHEHATLRAAVAAHPAAYPALLEWLGGLGDPAVAAVLAARQATPAAPAALPPAALPPAALPPAALPPAALSPAALPPAVRPPERATTAPPATLPAAAVVPENAAAPRRRRKPRRRKVLIGVLTTVGVLLAAGGAAAWVLVFSKLGGTSTPEAAVTQLVEGAASRDPIAMYGVLSPAELALVPNLRDIALSSYPEGVPPRMSSALGELWRSFDVDIDGLEVEVEEIADDVAKVYFRQGTISVDFAPIGMTQLALALRYDVTDPFVADPPYFTKYDADSRAQLWWRDHEELLETFDRPRSERTWGASELRFWSENERADSDAFLMAVREGGSWYVSPLLTVAEYGFAASDHRRGSIPAESELATYDSPEAVGAAIPEVWESLQRGDTGPLQSMLPLAERRLVALYGTDLARQISNDVEVVSAEFTTLSQDGDRVLLGVDDVALTYRDTWDGWTGEVRLFDTACYDFSPDPDWSMPHGGCLDEIPIAKEFDLDELGLVAMKDGDSWRISVLGSVVHLGQRWAAGITELAEDGIELSRLSCNDRLLQVPESSRAAWADWNTYCYDDSY